MSSCMQLHPGVDPGKLPLETSPGFNSFCLFHDVHIVREVVASVYPALAQLCFIFCMAVKPM